MYSGVQITNYSQKALGFMYVQHFVLIHLISVKFVEVVDRLPFPSLPRAM